MDKNTKQKQYYTYNRDIVKRLRQKYGFTPNFIYASLRGDRVSESSIKIVEDYKIMQREINNILKTL